MNTNTQEKLVITDYNTKELRFLYVTSEDISINNNLKIYAEINSFITDNSCRINIKIYVLQKLF